MTAVIAHRGASAHRPENTLEAFRHAYALGAGWVELDVRATADGALAVHHDDRLADGRAIAGTLRAELPAYVPLLDEALDACAPMAVNVEIKVAPPEPTIAAIRAWGGDVIVSSFDPAVIDRVHELAPDIPTAQLTYVLDGALEGVLRDIAERGHAWWHPWHPLLVDDSVVVAACDAGLQVNTWTVDDPVRIAALASWGVAGIVTNDVSTAVAALGRRDI
jgi:glycerophosphoryl diester phosphodiesterase